MISYICIDDTTIETTDSLADAIAFLRAADIDSAEIYEAPQATLWDAEQAGFDGARSTGRFVWAA